MSAFLLGFLDFFDSLGSKADFWADFWAESWADCLTTLDLLVDCLTRTTLDLAELRDILHALGYRLSAKPIDAK